MSKQAKDNFLVLVADDSESDRILLKKAMERATTLRIIGEVANGHDVISYLKGHAHFNDREKYPLPDLLLLDLKMPLKDGFEVLTWLRTQSFQNLTVVVLTDSMHAEHIKRALDLGADLFQVKPKMPHDLNAMILALEEHLQLFARTPTRRTHLPAAMRL
ncbi:MAG TPA: response regulator [Verrucomicrobiae bacterium]|jgi:CheY-like chemotaxis protein|nr:response regulator [Verrucomicrobiae bacterium]